MININLIIKTYVSKIHIDAIEQEFTEFYSLENYRFYNAFLFIYIVAAENVVGTTSAVGSLIIQCKYLFQ